MTGENNNKMYQKGKTINISNSVGMLSKNLQVVSFDGDWREIYLGKKGQLKKFGVLNQLVFVD